MNIATLFTSWSLSNHYYDLLIEHMEIQPHSSLFQCQQEQLVVGTAMLDV